MFTPMSSHHPAPARARVSVSSRPRTFSFQPRTNTSKSLSPPPANRPSTNLNANVQQNRSSPFPRNRASYPVSSFKVCETQVFPTLTSPGSPIEDPGVGYSDIFNYARGGEGPGHWREGLRSPHNPESKMQLRVKGAIADYTREYPNLSHLPFLEDSNNVRFLTVDPRGALSLSDKATLDLQTLADWLDDSRPTDPSGAYAMLLVAKDLIRRLLSNSVNIWNSSEDSVRSSLKQATDELAATQKNLAEERRRAAELHSRIQESTNNAAVHEVAARKDLLHTQIRLDKTKSDLDYAWVQLNNARKQIDDLQEENAEIRRCIEDSLWNPHRMNDLLTFICGLDHYVRFRMLQTLLMCEAEQGKMLEFVRSMQEDLGKPITDTIVDAFVIHKLESSEDPMELLKELAQQRVQVLGQQGRRRNLKAANMWNIPSALARNKAKEFAKKEQQRLQEEFEQDQEKEAQWRAAQEAPRRPSVSKLAVETAEAQTQTEEAPAPAPHPGGGRFAFLARSTIAGLRKGDPYGHRITGNEGESDDSPMPEAGLAGLAAGEGGARGRRGSVVLTTKKGKKGKKSGNEVTPVTIGKLIPQIYQDKVLQDLIDLREGRRPVPLTEFVKEFFSRRYGLAGLATKNYKEMVEGLSKYREHSRRISHFARNLGIGTDTPPSASDFVSEFYCRCLARLIPQEIIADRMSAKDCIVDFEVALQCLDHMLPANSPLAPAPALRAGLLKQTKMGKKFQPVIDIDEFMHHIMLEFLRVSAKSSAQPHSASNSPEASPRSREAANTSQPSSRRLSLADDAQAATARRSSVGGGRLGSIDQLRRSSLTGGGRGSLGLAAPKPAATTAPPE